MAGYGDGLTLGVTRYLRNKWDIGSVDENSTLYHQGTLLGNTVFTTVTGAKCLTRPDKLYHFTSKEGYEAIMKEGVIRVGQNNMWGKGVYATRYNSRIVAVLNGVMPKNSTHKIVIENTKEFTRKWSPIPGTWRTRGTPYYLLKK